MLSTPGQPPVEPLIRHKTTLTGPTDSPVRPAEGFPAEPDQVADQRAVNKENGYFQPSWRWFV